MSKSIIIVGAGIVGLGVAYQITKILPDVAVTILDKEERVATHQTARNSGVLHTGIYYKPGSYKAQNCVHGKRLMEQFCDQHSIAYERCGKVIVATQERELGPLKMLLERGQNNGVICNEIGPEQLREIEPNATGIKALHVPEAGIVDYTEVSNRLADLIVKAGGEIFCSAKVGKIISSKFNRAIVSTSRGEFEADMIINCAGLHCDKIAKLAGHQISIQIFPFRGEYYKLVAGREAICRNLIYPVPDLTFPFLGVHFTRMITGGVECGPNAVLALGREAYKKSDLCLAEVGEFFRFPGFYRLMAQHWARGLSEYWRSFSKQAFVRALQCLVPDIKTDDIEPAPSGIRAQALARNGKLVDDFLIEQTDRVIHVLNAPSPAATSSLNIGMHVVQLLAQSDFSRIRQSNAG